MAARKTSDLDSAYLQCAGYQIIARAETWLRTHPYTNPIVKWETDKWGEVPADFGRK